jgi:DNA-binding winged helix-turn-helix (wHTH) protein/tetratricopeptide (TPR) repeat protein
MTANVSEASVIRFGPFELALETGELRRDGAPVKLQPQPATVLALLATRPGELVTREEIQQRVWSGETFVDFEHGVNFCIKEIRAALGDSARAPHYVETLPRRGYRFVAPVEAAVEPASAGAGPEAGEPVPPDASPRPAPASRRAAMLVLGGVLRAVGAVAVPWLRSAARPPAGAPDPAAHEAYLMGRYLWNKGTSDDVARSLEHFDRATRLDPQYAMAYVGLADSYRLLAMHGGRPVREDSERAKAAALRALELDPRLAEARVSLGSILFRYEWDWAGAERELRRAVAERPDYGLGRHDYAWFLVAVGRFDEALVEIRAARDLDPLSPVANADVGWVFLRARRYDEAIAEIERTLELEPGFGSAYACLELAYVYKGMYAEARDVARRHLEHSGAEADVLAAVGDGDPAEGLRRARRWQLERRLATARERPVKPYPFAALYAALGERDRAFEWLDRAYEERDPMLASVNVDPAFDGLRADARFADLLRRIGLGG